MKVNKPIYFLFFIILINIFSQFVKCDEYIIVEDEFSINSFERDVDTYQSNPKLYYIYTTFQFASYNEFSNNSFESGSTYSWNVDSSSLIAVNDLQLQETYVEQIKTLSWANGIANFDWVSGIDIKTVHSRILFDTEIFNNVSIITDYAKINIVNDSSILYVNGTNSNLNIDEIETLAIEINYDFINDIIIFNIFDYLDLNENNYFTLSNLIENETDNIYIDISNNHEKPIQIFGVGINCEEITSTQTRSGRDFFEWVFPYTSEEWYFYEKNTIIDTNASIENYEAIYYSEDIQDEYAGFDTFRYFRVESDSIFHNNGSVSAGLKALGPDEDRDNTETVGNDFGGNLGLSYADLQYPISSSFLFEFWMDNSNSNTDNYNNSFKGVGIGLDGNRNVWLGTTYRYTLVPSVHQYRLTVIIEDNGILSVHHLKNVDSSPAYIKYLSLQIASNYIYVFESHSLVNSIAYDLSDISILTNYSIYGNGSSVSCGIDSIGFKDNDNPDNPFFMNGYVEFYLFTELGTNYGLNLDYNIFKDSYDFSEHTNTFGNNKLFDYYVLDLDNTGIDESENYYPIGQETFGSIESNCYLTELEILSSLPDSPYNLSLVDLSNIETGFSVSLYNATSHYEGEYFSFRIVILTNETLNISGYFQQIEYSKFDDLSTYNDGYIFEDYMYVAIDLENLTKYQIYGLREFSYRYYYLQSQESLFRIKVSTGYQMAICDVLVSDNYSISIERRIEQDTFYFIFDIDLNKFPDEFIGFYIYVLDVITSTRSITMQTSIVFKSTYLGSNKYLLDEGNNLLIQITLGVMNIIINGSIVILIPAFLQKRFGKGGFAIGFILSILIVFFLGLFDTISLVMLVIICGLILFLQYKRNEGNII